jgi:hypothetical protein
MFPDVTITFDSLLSVKYVEDPIQRRFEGTTLPIPTFPVVLIRVAKRFPFTNRTFDPMSVTHKFDPTVRMFDVPKALPIATLPVVIKEFDVFVSLIVFDDVFPKFTTCSSVSES